MATIDLMGKNYRDTLRRIKEENVAMRKRELEMEEKELERFEQESA